MKQILLINHHRQVYKWDICTDDRRYLEMNAIIGLRLVPNFLRQLHRYVASHNFVGQDFLQQGICSGWGTPGGGKGGKEQIWGQLPPPPWLHTCNHNE